MDSATLRKQFLDFFEKRGHTIVPSSSLIPDDPSVLLTTAGMQQFKKYFTGEADPMRDFGSKNTASIQKSFRTSDIDEVGDESHLTFFEMLGNFSFGGYFKEEAIKYAKEFLESIGLIIEYVTVFGGDVKIPFDEESYKIWQSLGIKDIRRAGREDNFWGPTGSEGPCGPTTEIYINGTEIWNLVFNEYYCKSNGSLEKLATPGIDTGMGLERLAMVVQGKSNIFDTDLFASLLGILPKEIPERQKRIIGDHLRGAMFLFFDGIRPSNKERGYILRRLVRRAVAYEYLNKMPSRIFEEIFHIIATDYGSFYTEFIQEQVAILGEFRNEREKFIKVLELGMKEFFTRESRGRFGGIGTFWDQKILYGNDAFYFYQTFGFPREVMRDLVREYGGTFDEEGFELEFKKHQEISRAGQEKKFGGHGLVLNTGELKAANEDEVKIVTRLHTATHLLQAALRSILGQEAHQMGSDITAERTRFDFSFPRKLTDEEKKQVEDWVNDAIKRDLPMTREEMSYEEAIKSGALHFFREKYPERVNVYSIIDQKSGEVVSRELCGGPHVSRTDEVGHFRITKEEAVGAGIRRIRAAIE